MLYDYYVNGFEEGSSLTYLPPVFAFQPSKNPQTRLPTYTLSRHSLILWMSRKNVEPMAVKVAAIEEWLFNHPDPYDLAKIECLEKALQTPITSVFWSVWHSRICQAWWPHCHHHKCWQSGSWSRFHFAKIRNRRNTWSVEVVIFLARGGSF